MRIEEPKTCPPEFMENKETRSCYKFGTDRITWRMAREKCRAQDADLVTINTRREQKYLAQTARENPCKLEFRLYQPELLFRGFFSLSSCKVWYKNDFDTCVQSTWEMPDMGVWFSFLADPSAMIGSLPENIVSFSWIHQKGPASNLSKWVWQEPLTLPL